MTGNTKEKGETMSDQQLQDRLYIIWGCFLAEGTSLKNAMALSREYEQTENELLRRGREDLVKQFADGFCL